MRKIIIIILSLIIINGCKSSPSVKVADRQFQKGYYHNSAKIYRDFLHNRKLSRKKETAYFGLAWSDYFIGEDAEALESINKLLTKYPKTLYKENAYLLKSLILFQLERYNESLKIINDIINNENNQISKLFVQELKFIKSDIYRRMGDRKQSIKSYTDYITEFPSGERINESYFYRALCYNNNKEYEKAMEDISKISTDDVKISEAAFVLKTSILYTKGDTATVKNNFEKFVTEHPESKWSQNIYTYLGNIALKNKENDNALKYFKNIIENPKTGDSFKASAFYKLGGIYTEANNNDSAVQSYLQIINHYKNTTWFRISVKHLYNIYIEDKRFDLSSELSDKFPYIIEKTEGYSLEELAKLQVKYQKNDFNKVQSLVDLGKKEEALTLLEDLLSRGLIDENIKAQALILAGNLLKKSGRIEESADKYFEAFLIAKNDKEKEVTLENLLTLYLKLGEKEKAERTRVALEALRKYGVNN